MILESIVQTSFKEEKGKRTNRSIIPSPKPYYSSSAPFFPRHCTCALSRPLCFSSPHRTTQQICVALARYRSPASLYRHQQLPFPVPRRRRENEAERVSQNVKAEAQKSQVFDMLNSTQRVIQKELVE